MKIFQNVIWICSLALALSACQKPHSHEESGHPHEEEPKTAQITVWGERHEIFAEHRLVVAGKPTKFVTHVTDLKTLEPRREGPVRFQMKPGAEAPLEQTEKTPTRAGIYEAMLTFPKPGDWQVSVVIPTEEGEKTIPLPSIKVFASEQEAAQAKVPEAPEGISFLKEQQWKILSKTEPVTKRRLVERLILPANIIPRPGSMAQIVPPIAGRVLPPSGQSMPAVGTKVKAGQTLALIQPAFSEMGARFVEAEGEVTRTSLNLQQARAAYERIKKLAAAQAKTERELQEAEFAVKSAEASHNAALALQSTYKQLTANLSGALTNGFAMELKAPIDGTVVAQSGAAVGEYVPADKSLFTVLDNSSVFVEAKVPEASVSRLSNTRDAAIESPKDKGQFMPLRSVFSGLQVDPATRTVPLTYELKNEGGLFLLGQAVNLHVETKRAEEAVAIPDSAIVEEAGQFVAFVQVSGETFEKRELTLGIRDGNFVQVINGIRPGERVVTKGAYAIRLSSVSGVIPAHGHAH